MIAVMIAAAMCVVPLFVIEDSDADIEETSSGVSFKAGSIADSNFNAFVSADYKMTLAFDVLEVVVDSNSDSWTITDIVIKNVKDVKMSRGNELTSRDFTSSEAWAIKFDITFNAKYTGLLPIQLFSTEDGTQALYKAFNGNTIVTDDVISVDGTYTMGESDIRTADFEKAESGKYITTETSIKAYKETAFNGSFVFKEKKVTLDATMEMSYEAKTVSEFDVKVADVTSATKAFATTSIESAGVTSNVYYKVGDDSCTLKREYGKDVMELLAGLMLPIGVGYQAGEAGALGLVTDEAAMVLKVETYVPYDSTDESIALVTDDMLADSYHNTDSVISFFNDNGTYSEEYSAAESVANAEYSTVSVGGSNGGSKVIFYVIIGVLAIAVVALAVLMIKKK